MPWFSPARLATRSASVGAPHTVMPVASAASDRLPKGTIARFRPAARAASNAGSTPRTGRVENRNGQGYVVPGAALAQRGRGQSQGDPPVGPFVTGVDDRRPDPIA